MSKEQNDLIAELLKRIADSKDMGDMSFTTGKELTSLVRQLQVA